GFKKSTWCLRGIHKVDVATVVDLIDIVPDARLVPRRNILLKHMQHSRIKQLLDAVISNATRKQKCPRLSLSDYLINHLGKEPVQIWVATYHGLFVLLIPIPCRIAHMGHRNFVSECLRRDFGGEVQCVAWHSFDSANKLLEHRHLCKGNLH